ncbi:polysaccharide deacetylase family protein [Streptomyces erythrochromogenes]|uniref:polysaccharide deacetylase family protein n=1 Tax=Streptomyces erythrochromogenes TaxID=285574 RepID=UPI003422C1A7
MHTRNGLRHTATTVAAASVLALTAMIGVHGTASAAPLPAAGGSTAVAPVQAGAPSTADSAAPGKIPAGFVKTSEGGPKTVDITIDDGPSPQWTPKVLAVLAQNHAKATFCMIGENAQKYPALVKEVVAAGDRLCDHSLDHDMSMDKKPASYQEREIVQGQKLVDAAAGGAKSMYYRAPGGAFTAESRQIAAAHGLRPLSWDIDPRDWSRPGTASIVSKVEGQLEKDGPAKAPIVLLHDGGGDRSQTVAALQKILPWIKANGYGFSFPSQTGP